MNRLYNCVFSILAIVTGLAGCNPEPEQVQPLEVALKSNWSFRQMETGPWYKAVVPGTVHTDLLLNNIIEDPYYRLNEKQLQWIDKKDWEYRTSFYVDKDVLNNDRVELDFEGLDTYARVFLNGSLILEADNMFRRWTADVKGKIRAGDNELVVLLESPTRKGLEALSAYGFQLAADNDQSENGEMGADRVSPYVRKAPYHFGWDWGPRLVTSGIWRPVKLRAWSGARIESVKITTIEITSEMASVEAEVEVEVARAGRYWINVRQRDGVPRDAIPRDAIPGLHLVKIPLTIHNPKTWNPNGLGEQYIYHFDIELTNNDKVVDETEVTAGLRRVRLVQEPDPDGKGRSFYFEVNGKPVFAKGANYIPNDIFLNRVTPDRYEFIVKSAADAHMNMLRVWGGGVYEVDLFYELCDQYGIMVWQDFMFACAMYPGNDEFLENVRLEAIDNVKRLRNHPCLVLWCGNNEIEAAWGPYDENRGWGWKQRYNDEQREIIWQAYDTLFHKILPDVVQKYDPGMPYWHSSPSAGMGELASYETASGDIHYWGVWHGLHALTDFRHYRGRFMSEYGFQSFPEFNSVKKYTLPEDHSIESPVMMAHQRSGIGNLRIRQYMETDYIIPADFEQFLYVGQLLQAEAIKLAIESHRAEMPYCMGSLYWQINDCWPVASWSGIDYYGRWKALHYFVKEAFKPEILVCFEQNDSIKVKIIPDDPGNESFQVKMTLMDFTGKVIWQNSRANIFPNEISSRPLSEILHNTDPASVVLVSELMRNDEILDRDLHYFVKPKDLKLIDPQIKMEFLERGDDVAVTVSSKSLAKNVFLFYDGEEEQFSDNFFDVLPGESVKITFPKGRSTVQNYRSLKALHLFMTK